MRATHKFLPALIVVGVMGLGPAPAAQAGPLHSCGRVMIGGESFRLSKKGKVTCRDAAKVMRAFLTDRGVKPGGPSQAETYWTVFGWTCGTGTGGGGCKRHHGRDYAAATQ